MSVNLPLAGLKGAIHRERGQDAIESALTLMMFMVLVMGIVDVAWAFFTHQTIQPAATEGVRPGAWDPGGLAKIVKLC